jgi:hypothetical protein
MNILNEMKELVTGGIALDVRVYIGFNLVPLIGLCKYGNTFNSRRVKVFPLFHSVQTGSGTHPVSYTMGTGGLFPPGMKLTIHLHPVPNSRMVELLHHFPVCLHGILFNLNTGTTLPYAFIFCCHKTWDFACDQLSEYVLLKEDSGVCRYQVTELTALNK